MNWIGVFLVEKSTDIVCFSATKLLMLKYCDLHLDSNDE